MKTDRLFHGYNCYSAVVGEYCRGTEFAGVHDLILSQWSFFFDKKMLLNGQWFTGAADGPVDILLQEDLKQFCSLEVEEHYPGNRVSQCEMENLLKIKNKVIILVDFYYLESVRWEHLERFGIQRLHDPHFIIIESMDKDSIKFLDPYYNFRGCMDYSILQKAQSSVTRQGEVGYRYYSVQYNRNRKINLREVISYRLKRYIDEKYYSAIADLGEELVSNSDFIMGQKDFRWAVDACFCLKSTLDQHSNLRDITYANSITLPSELTDLENEWAIIRKTIFGMFVSHRTSMSDLLDLRNRFQGISKMEKAFACKVIDFL